MKNEISKTSKELIKTLDETKINVLKLLYNCGENKRLCGSNLCDKLNISKNLLSYHIKTLQKASLLGLKKVGRNKYYFVPDSKKLQVKKLLEALEII